MIRLLCIAVGTLFGMRADSRPKYVTAGVDLMRFYMPMGISRAPGPGHWTAPLPGFQKDIRYNAGVSDLGIIVLEPRFLILVRNAVTVLCCA